MNARRKVARLARAVVEAEAAERRYEGWCLPSAQAVTNAAQSRYERAVRRLNATARSR